MFFISESETREPAFVLVSKTGSTDFIKNITVTTSEVKTVTSQQTKANNSNKKKNSNKSGNNRNKTKQSNKTQPKPKVKATLFGLSTLKRDGDVLVNVVKDHTLVKTNFLLGPLTLRVDREVSST